MEGRGQYKVFCRDGNILFIGLNNINTMVGSLFLVFTRREWEDLGIQYREL